MTNTEITVDEAVSVIRRDYYRDVLSIAKDLAERMKAGTVTEFSDALHEQCGDSRRVIITFQAKLGLLVSDNEGAAAEAFGGADAQLQTVEQRMFYALTVDVTQRLEAGGVDVNEPKTWAEIDLTAFD